MLVLLSHPTKYLASLPLRHSTVRSKLPLRTSDLTIHTGKILKAWTQTPTKWYPLPLAVGALLLVAIQYHKTARAQKEVHVDDQGREVIKLKGPWQVRTRVLLILRAINPRQVHVLGALPLRNLSRVWGYLNSFELPIWLRPYGIRFYASVFGCNLDEIEPSDLTKYASLGEFFYRKLKPGARPVDGAVLVSRGLQHFVGPSLSALSGQSSGWDRDSFRYHR